MAFFKLKLTCDEWDVSQGERFNKVTQESASYFTLETLIIKWLFYQYRWLSNKSTLWNQLQSWVHVQALTHHFSLTYHNARSHTPIYPVSIYANQIIK